MLFRSHALNRFMVQYPGAIGVKNGYTRLAGNCVAAAAVRRNGTLVVIVLNDWDAYELAARLMDAAFRVSPPRAWVPPVAPPSLTELEQPVAAPVPALAVAPAEQRAVARVRHARHWWRYGLLIVGFAYVVRVVQVKRRAARRRRARRVLERRMRVEAMARSAQRRAAPTFPPPVWDVRDEERAATPPRRQRHDRPAGVRS